jgi:hypothetical protein
MRSILLVLATGLVSVRLAFPQIPSAKPVSAFEQQLITQQKQFLQATQSKDSAAVERAIADARKANWYGYCACVRFQLREELPKLRSG